MTRQAKITKNVEYLAKQYLSGKTLQEIADEFGCSRERIRQILVKNGFITRELKNFGKTAAQRQLKPIADKVLIESTNRIVDHCQEKQRRAETKLQQRIQYHRHFINSYMGTVERCWKLIDTVQKKIQDENLTQAKSLLERQLRAFNEYRRIIEEKNDKPIVY